MYIFKAIGNQTFFRIGKKHFIRAQKPLRNEGSGNVIIVKVASFVRLPL
jgi:hypothetical protein